MRQLFRGPKARGTTNLATLHSMSTARDEVWKLWSLPALPALHGAIAASAQQAASAVDAAAELSPQLRQEFTAAILFRLAEAKLFAGDPMAAEEVLQAIGSATPNESPWRYAAGVRACRVAMRRGQHELAQSALITAAQNMPTHQALAALTADMVGSDAHAWRCAVLELGIAIAEFEIQQTEPDRAALDALRALQTMPTLDAGRDQLFTIRQLLTAAAFTDGDANAASVALRANIKFAHAEHSPADEIEARLALIGVLVEQGGAVNLAEAARHAQQARDAALAIADARPELHMAALVAQAAVLERTGRRAGALDRCVEVATHAATQGNIHQYVAAVGMMAEMYTRSGDIASAFRTLAESNHALSEATGSSTVQLFRPFMQRLQEQAGIERLRKVTADVAAANELFAIT